MPYKNGALTRLQRTLLNFLYSFQKENNRINTVFIVYRETIFHIKIKSYDN